MKRILILLSVLGILTITATMTRANDTSYVYADEQPAVEVWLNRADGAIYDQGESVRVHFQVFEESYVAVYNVDTEGFVHLLYPKYDDPVYLAAGSAVAIPGPYDDYNLVISSPAGIEYVVAVASPYPLNYDALQPVAEAADYGDTEYRMRVSGDPEQAITAINEDLAWSSEYASSDPYASDVSWFYVDQQVPYPRYLVYHAYAEQIYDPYWDPYVHVQLRVRFEWNHHWCRPIWWCYGCRPVYTNWFFDPRSGRHHHWKTHYARHWSKPGRHRDKAPRWVEVNRDRRHKPTRPPVVWTDKPGGHKNGHASASKPSRSQAKDKAFRVSEAPRQRDLKPIRQASPKNGTKPLRQQATGSKSKENQVKSNKPNQARPKPSAAKRSTAPKRSSSPAAVKKSPQQKNKAPAKQRASQSKSSGSKNRTKQKDSVGKSKSSGRSSR